MANGDTAFLLRQVFDRLYMLRCQIMHGGATWNGKVNRRQVRDAADILRTVMPVIVDIMMDHPEDVWGRPFYPVVTARRHESESGTTGSDILACDNPIDPKRTPKERRCAPTPFTSSLPRPAGCGPLTEGLLHDVSCFHTRNRGRCASYWRQVVLRGPKGLPPRLNAARAGIWVIFFARSPASFAFSNGPLLPNDW